MPWPLLGCPVARLLVEVFPRGLVWGDKSRHFVEHIPRFTLKFYRLEAALLWRELSLLPLAWIQGTWVIKIRVSPSGLQHGVGDCAGDVGYGSWNHALWSALLLCVGPWLLWKLKCARWPKNNCTGLSHDGDHCSWFLCTCRRFNWRDLMVVKRIWSDSEDDGNRYINLFSHSPFKLNVKQASVFHCFKACTLLWYAWDSLPLLPGLWCTPYYLLQHPPSTVKVSVFCVFSPVKTIFFGLEFLCYENNGCVFTFQL